MKKVQLGNSDIYVTPVTFGAWAIGGWMWGGADHQEAVMAIHASIDHGISTLDTAPVYGFGLSEEIIGEALAGRRDKVEILTKYGMRWEGNKGEFAFDTTDNAGKPLKIYKYASRESVISECEESLKRLKTDYIDLYQIHWPDGTTPVEETMEAVELLLQQGKIRAAGVCNYSVELTAQAMKSVPIASNQVPYSMVRRDIEDELLPWCIKHDVSVLAYSPLQRGLLTGKIRPGQSFGVGDSRPDTPWFSNRNIERVNHFLESIKPLADGHKATLGQLVTAWTIAQPGITVALVGARNGKQAAENAGAMDLNLSDNEVAMISDQLSKLDLDMQA
jgi:aryl-alcohol dehydrogenase-like predicted oxidoreductase